MDFLPAHPGPVEDQLLVLQGDHRSSFLDWSLITTLVEWWRPKTHTFHLPTGEATITLEDVQGDAVQRGGSRVALLAIRDHMAFLHPDITGETDDLHIERYTRLALLLLFGGVLFPNTSGSLVSMRFLHHLQQLDDLPIYSWGVAVWAWQRVMPLQPPLPPGEAYPFLPIASRWVLRRGNYRGTNAHHNLPLVRDVLDMLVAGQFIWTPYNDELLAQLPDYCSVDRLLWSTSVPMIFFDMVEYHATERVLRQFHRSQPIPGEPAWIPTHYQRDDCIRVDDIFMGWLEQQEATIHLYMPWYRCHTRLMIGNPIHVLSERYRPYAGRHESLAIGHHLVYQLGQEMQQHADSAALVAYGRQVADLARQTLFQARDGASLDHEDQYAAPEDYHRGRVVPRGRGRARERGALRGRGGRRGGGP
uniref:Serine/threonine-protein phosphatase 7 long form homolog n=1 Tax=Nicotiana tabacum TaxID=4097 RepID=A0A1S3XKV5_TOBAC|nr:PREDICTED: serine/threonine-protein phosphatase 7 long form homolog [Nicotiana tabacum]